MKKIISALSLIAVLTLSACGSSGTPIPQLNVLDVQNTAIAQAWTDVAMTQAALPTATPIPPTFTAEPTFTPFPTLPPTIAFPPTAAAVFVPTKGVDCNVPIPLPVKGEVAKVKFVNKSNGTASLSFGMLTINDKNECGIFSFTIPPKQTAEVDVLVNCYWGFAYVIEGNNTSTAKTKENICVDQSKILGVTITAEWIGLD